MPLNMQRSPKTRLSWRLCLIPLLLSSCNTVPPKWDGKLWQGDSATQSIQRAQAQEAVSCAAPEFNRYICLSGEDFKSFYETYVLGCKEWRAGLGPFTFSELVVAQKMLDQLWAKAL